MACSRRGDDLPCLRSHAALGGWTKVQKKFFDPNTGLMTKIEQGLGG